MREEGLTKREASAFCTVTAALTCHPTVHHFLARPSSEQKTFFERGLGSCKDIGVGNVMTSRRESLEREQKVMMAMAITQAGASFIGMPPDAETESVRFGWSVRV